MTPRESLAVVSLSRAKFSALSKVGEGVILVIRDVGVSHLRSGGVGGVGGLYRRVGDGVTLWGESVLRLDSMVMNVGEGERVLSEGEGARRSTDLDRPTSSFFFSCEDSFLVWLSTLAEPMLILDIFGDAAPETTLSDAGSLSQIGRAHV